MQLESEFNGLNFDKNILIPYSSLSFIYLTKFHHSSSSEYHSVAYARLQSSYSLLSKLIQACFARTRQVRAIIRVIFTSFSLTAIATLINLLNSAKAQGKNAQNIIMSWSWLYFYCFVAFKWLLNMHLLLFFCVVVFTVCGFCLYFVKCFTFALVLIAACSR